LSHVLEDDAPKVLGHGSISKWAIMATERQIPWSGGGTYTEIVGTKINVGIQYIQNEGNVHNSKMRQPGKQKHEEAITDF
jgi:hypothetical protein